MFNLATGRSRGFGPFADDLRRHLKTRFRYGSVAVRLSLAADKYSPVHYAKGTPSPVLSCESIGLRPLVSAWFQVLFTRLVAVLFIVQSPYSFTIGHRGVFSLARWAGPLRTEFHELRATLERLSTPIVRLDAYGAFTRSGPSFQTVPLAGFQLKASTTPGRTPVWALPRSLAATDGIDVSFCSCG